MQEETKREENKQLLARPRQRWPWVVAGLMAAILALIVIGEMRQADGNTGNETGLAGKSDSLPQFIQADFIDLSQIYLISKFRSGSGHDFSGNGESCRSMKHYFNVQWSEEGERERSENNGFPKPPSPGRAIDIFSPVDGEITAVETEKTPIGSQIYIEPDNAPKYTVRLFHIYLLPDFKKGSEVKAGQKIGEIGLHQNTDISVMKGSRWKNELISYFEVMPDSIFEKYKERGVKDRSELIVSKEERDRNPLKCNGEQFAVNYDSTEPDKHFIYLSGYADPNRR